MATQAFKIGNLVLKNSNILSPLEGVSCVGFRALCHRNGAALTFTEMIRAQAIQRRNQSTLDLIDTHDPDTPTGLQLLAKSSGELIGALTILERMAGEKSGHHFHNISSVDINFGCPSPEIIRSGAGPAMLKRRARLMEMFRDFALWRQHTSLRSIAAIGCKIRLGLNPSGMSQLPLTVQLTFIPMLAIYFSLFVIAQLIAFFQRRRIRCTCP